MTTCSVVNFQIGLSSLSLLAVLSLKMNSLNGSLPESLGSLETLRVLALSHNNFFGEVPDLGSLTSLQVLNLEDNSLGPQFPHLGNKLVTLILRKNKFSSGIPDEVSTYYQLQKLDICFNRFVGPFPSSFLSLPSITYLSIAGNRFTGMLFDNLSCNSELEFVDLSSNLLTGKLPNCFKSTLAVGILPHRWKSERASKVVLGLSISGGIIGGITLVGLAFVVVRRVHLKKTKGKPQPRLIAVHASTGYTSKLSSEARYVSQAKKIGALGVPSYRTFSLEELEVATDNFDTSTFLAEGSHGQMYRGQLKDGSVVAIRCLKMKRSHSTQNFMHHIEFISKLRHRHLVKRRARRTLSWTQRIAAAIGVAKGIEFLHTGIVPGVFSNSLKITDVLLDQNLVAKISSYNQPLLSENMEKVWRGVRNLSLIFSIGSYSWRK
ncbi:putative inactive leucine-rich repeat receptor-like protein kinase [Camellia lanceoleosa]|uniref:Inactive leucine-rich repeat receptor-like protein kinase n=1 Tax=Camellia lanceoleosa TaxID=1840588 RepID=A0ACC0FP45_9ERIC|nr:putative inactive leucine-rich repeat receptor-like protein kinase [Camellia lanceoleosa]